MGRAEQEAESGWQATEVIGNAGDREVTDLDVRFDGLGRALAFWVENQSGISEAIMAARYQ